MTREEINACLRRIYTEEGVLNWWNRPRTILGGLTPEEAWQDRRHEAVKQLCFRTSEGTSE